MYKKLNVMKKYKEMSYLAYIESPLQALNAIEYVNRTGCVSNALFLVNNGMKNKNYDQIIGVLNYFACNNISSIPVKGTFISLLQHRQAIVKVLNTCKLKDDCQIVLGEYRSILGGVVANYFKREERSIVVVDDGNETLRIDRRKRAISKKSLLKKILLSLCGFNPELNMPLVFFTVYEIGDALNAADKLIVNNYSFCKSNISQLKQENKIFIIGSPLAIAGVVDDDVQLTINLIRECKIRYPDVEMLYISHRREDDVKLTSISKEGIDVLPSKFPFELYPFYNDYRPKTLVGFTSSLFDNVHLIWGEDTEILSFVIPPALIHEEHVESYNAIYDKFKKNNITIISEY